MKLRGYRKFLSILLATAIIISGSPSISAEAAGTIRLDSRKILSVANKNATLANGSQVTATNLGAMCIVGSTLYCIKTNGDNKASVLYTITKYNTSSAQTTWKEIKNSSKKVESIGHANGMAYYNGYFYIATMKSHGEGSQVVKINKSGVIVANYYSQLTYSVHSITYYKNGYFIAGISSDKSGYRRYGVIKFEGNKIIRDKVFYVLNDSNWNGQDIHFEDNQFCIIRTPKNQQMIKNKILLIILDNSIVNGKIYEPDAIIMADAQNGESIYEIESMDMVYDKWIVCANCDSVKKDGIYELSGFEYVLDLIPRN